MLSLTLIIVGLAVGISVGLALSLVEWRARRYRDRVRPRFPSGTRHRRGA